MRATFLKSPSETSRILPSFRLVFGDFEVRMCRVFVWPRLILPVPVLLKRLAAPVWVFNLGIFFSFWTHLVVGQGLPCPGEPQSVYLRMGLSATHKSPAPNSKPRLA